VAAPGAAIGRVKDRGHLLAGEEAKNGSVEAFAGDGKDALGDRERDGVAYAGVPHERADRGKAGVAGAGPIAPFGLEVVEEVQHQGCVQVGHRQC